MAVVGSLAWMPTTLLVVASSALFATWALAVKHDQTRGSYFPLVCNAGAKRPSQDVFTAGLNFSAALFAVCVVLAHAKMDAEARAAGAGDAIEGFGIACACLGVMCALSLSLMGTFGYVERPREHNMAAGAFQTLSLTYQTCASIFTTAYASHVEGSAGEALRVTLVTRWVCVGVGTAAALGMVPCITLEARRQKAKNVARDRARAERAAVARTANESIEKAAAAAAGGFRSDPAPGVVDSKDGEGAEGAGAGDGASSSGHSDGGSGRGADAAATAGNGALAGAAAHAQAAAGGPVSDPAAPSMALTRAHAGSSADRHDPGAAPTNAAAAGKLAAPLPVSESDATDTTNVDIAVEAEVDAEVSQALSRGELARVSTAEVIALATVGQRRALRGFDSAALERGGKRRGVPRHLEAWAALQYLTFATMLAFISTFTRDLGAVTLTLQ